MEIIRYTRPGPNRPNLPGWGMKILRSRFCTFVRWNSYWIFGLRTPSPKTQGGYLLRNILLPVLVVVSVLYWLIIGGPITVAAIIWYTNRLPDNAQFWCIALNALLLAGWVSLYYASKPIPRRVTRSGKTPGSPGSPQVYANLLWPFWIIGWLRRLIASALQAWVGAYNKPFDPDDKK